MKTQLLGPGRLQPKLDVREGGLNERMRACLEFLILFFGARRVGLFQLMRDDRPD